LMDGDLVVGVFEIGRAEVGSYGLQRKTRKNQWVMVRGIRKESFAVEESGLKAGHALQTAGFLVGTSSVGAFHQVQHPYFAYRGRRHVLERKLELERIQV